MSVVVNSHSPVLVFKVPPEHTSVVGPGETHAYSMAQFESDDTKAVN